MSSVNFPSEDIVRLENSARLGGRAKDFKASGWWDWFNETILDAVDAKAMNTLRLATDETARVRAQMLTCAADEIRKTIEKLIMQGDGAKQQLSEIATLEKESANNA